MVAGEQNGYPLPSYVPRDTMNLSERIAKIEGSLDKFATKEDLHALTWKLIGVASALVAVVFYIARNAAPPQ